VLSSEIKPKVLIEHLGTKKNNRSAWGCGGFSFFDVLVAPLGRFTNGEAIPFFSVEAYPFKRTKTIAALWGCGGFSFLMCWSPPWAASPTVKQSRFQFRSIPFQENENNRSTLGLR